MALLRDPIKHSRFVQATSGYFELVACRQASRLFEEVLTNDPSVVVVEPRDVSGVLCGAELAALQAMFPTLPLVIYATVKANQMRDALALPQSTATRFLLADSEDDIEAIRRTLSGAAKDARVDAILYQLRRCLPASVIPIVQYCLKNARLKLTVANVAEAIGIRRQAVDKRLRKAGMPSAAKVIVWCRLLQAASLMRFLKLSIERIAIKLGFGSAAGLRNALKRYTGLTPSEVRGRGGMECVLCEFSKVVGTGTIKFPEVVMT
ncbi:MAG: helix-turn-helix domain-containing protein [Gemmatimonadaceae bacterium]